jgi:hypothetical protein
LEQSTRLRESKADAVAIADNDQAKAVVLDFVNPLRRRRPFYPDAAVFWFPPPSICR